MSEQTVRATYYPSLTLTIGETRFGSKKLLAPSNPYVCPLKNKKRIIRVDALECLRNIWGDSILLNRENIYKLVSGDTDDKTYRKLLCSYYRSHSSFSNYISYVMLYGDRNVPFITRFTHSVRDYIQSYIQSVEEVVYSTSGSKFLLYDHEYLYYAIVQSCDVSALKGVVEIA